MFARNKMDQRRIAVKNKGFCRLAKNCGPPNLLDGIFEVWWHLRKFLWLKKIVRTRNEGQKWLPVDRFFFCKTNKILSTANRALNNFSVVKAKSVDYSWTSPNSHLSITAILFFLADSSYIHSCFNFSKKATSLQWPLSSVPKVAIAERFNCIFFLFRFRATLWNKEEHYIILFKIQETRKRVVRTIRVSKPTWKWSSAISLAWNGWTAQQNIVVFRPIWRKCLLDILYQWLEEAIL